ncbi:MAG: YdcF family protein [Betaproteobacteria bacterium]|nr:YdcF family protein [Betaproteobacteria bacterium]
MASPTPEVLSAASPWPLQGVRIVKDFSFDLGFVVLLGVALVLLKRGLRGASLACLVLPFALLVFAGARGLPELWAKPILSKTAQLSQEGCRAGLGALVVLGGGLAGADDLAVSTMSRVRHAARWMVALSPDERRTIKVVMSGGPSLAGVPRPESELMKDAFRAWRADIPEENIVTESQSLNTRDNATRVASYLQSLRLKPEIALVTSSLHMPRAVGAFRAAGLRPCPVPSPGVEYSSEGFLNFRNAERTVRVLNEYAGFIGYRAMGWMK